MSHLTTMLAEAATGHSDLGIRGAWLAIMMLGAFVVALVAGVLKWLAERPSVAVGAPASGFDGRALAAAVLYAGVAFGSTITLLSLIYYFLVR
jgi:uncharacterized iron-regulated membrane protein